MKAGRRHYSSSTSVQGRGGLRVPVEKFRQVGGEASGGVHRGKWARETWWRIWGGLGLGICI